MFVHSYYYCVSVHCISITVSGKHFLHLIIPSDIPQGAVLGLLLFQIFVNDIPIGVKSSIKLFADDDNIIENATNKKINDENLKGL